MTEIRYRTAEIRADQTGRTIYGLAVPYNTPTEIRDSFGDYTEVFAPGAFARSIQQRGDKIRLLANHDARSFPVGKATELRETADGLYAAFEVPETRAGDEALALVRSGTVTGLSVGFAPVRDQTRSDGTVVRVEASLREISLTAFPAYETTTAAARNKATTAPLAETRLATYLDGDEPSLRKLERLIERADDELYTLTERDALTEADEDRLDTLETVLERAYAARRTLKTKDTPSMSREEMIAAVERGHVDTKTWRATTVELTPETRALRLVEDQHKRGVIGDGAAETVEKLVTTGGSASRSQAAEWATVTGSEDYVRAFGKLLADPHKGHLRWTTEEQRAYENVQRYRDRFEARAMSTGAGVGGELLPFVLDPAINLTNAGTNNPLRQVARVVTTTSNSWHGVTSAGSTAEWLAEAAQSADGSPALAQPAIPVYKAQVFVPFSVEVEGDAGGNFMSELQMVLADSANRLTSTAYTTGAGSTQPKGLITALAAAGGSVVQTGTGTEALAAADAYKLQNALAARWQPNASWLGHLATMNQFRQFETTNGALKFPSLQNVPPSLLGRAFHECSDMDGTINPAAVENNYAMVYGDFKQFVIVDRIGSTVELVPHLFGANNRPTGQRGIILWLRTGSDCLIPDAFRVLNVPTS